MENNENEKKVVEDRHYRVRCGSEYYIRKSVVDREDYKVVNYSIPLAKKTNGKTEYYSKKIRFKSGVELKDKTKILIKDMFEDVAENKRDKYNPIWHLFILDFEVVEEPDDVVGAIYDYQDNIENARIDREREDNNDWLF